jgi:hypothetical protein
MPGLADLTDHVQLVTQMHQAQPAFSPDIEYMLTLDESA